MAAQSLVDFGKQHVAAGLGRVVNDAVIESGQGSYVTLSDGRTVLDFTCGIAVTNLGAIAFNETMIESDIR